MKRLIVTADDFGAAREVNEAVEAAHRGGIKTVLLPKDNEKDIAEIPQQVLKDVALSQVEHMDEVQKQALVLLDPEAFFQSKSAESAPFVS